MEKPGGKPFDSYSGIAFSGSRIWIDLSEHGIKARGLASLCGVFYLTSSG